VRILLMAICLALMSCASPDSNEKRSNAPPSPCEWDYDHVGPAVRKTNPEFTDEEFAVLASVYDRVVTGHFLVIAVSLPRELIVTLGTGAQTDLVPPAWFLDRIATPGIVVRAPVKGEYRYEPWIRSCELRLWGWRGGERQDSATVEVYFGSLSKDAIAIRVGDGWTVCPSDVIGHSSGVIPPRPNKRMQPTRGASAPSDSAR